MDLSSIFQPLSLGTQYSTATGFKVGSQDFNEIFAMKPGSGETANPTGFLIGNQDLNQFFAKYNPVSPPGPPKGLTLTPGLTDIQVAWTAPSSNGGSAITSYRVNWSGGNFVNTNNTQTNYTITGLNYGTNYTVNVQAVNQVGTGPASTNATTTTETTTPSAPLNFSLTSGNQQIYARWSDPASSGGLPFYFTIYYAPSNNPSYIDISPIDSTNYTINNLVNGILYSVYVVAVNDKGPGPPTSVLSATPATVPSAPPRPGGRPDIGVMYLTWQAPSSDGGSPILNYRLIAQGNGTEQTHDTDNNDQFSYTWYLERGNYDLSVEAINSMGVGARSPELFVFVS